MRGGKRWNKAKNKISKEAEGRSAKSVTDRQTNRTNSAATYCQYLTLAALLQKNH